MAMGCFISGTIVLLLTMHCINKIYGSSGGGTPGQSGIAFAPFKQWDAT
jgi:hypothetical protein